MSQHVEIDEKNKLWETGSSASRSDNAYLPYTAEHDLKHTHTHTAVFGPFFQDYPGGPVPER